MKSHQRFLMGVIVTLVSSSVMIAQSVDQVGRVAPSPTTESAWQLSSLNSPMGDNTGIMLIAKQLPLDRSSEISNEGRLSIQCTKKNGVEVILRTGLALKYSGTMNDTRHKGLLGSLSKHGDESLSPVRIRLDQQKIRSEEWRMGADRSNLLAYKPKALIDAILKSQTQQVLLEVHPYNGNPVVFRFDVRGLSEYRAQLHENCGY